MQISKKSEYGLRAMIYLAKVFSPKKVFSLKEISEKEDIPFDFLEKIFMELKEAGLIKSKKGVQGGYFLAKNPKNVSAKEVVKTLEKTMFQAGCFGCQKAGICSAQDVLEELETSLDDALGSITLEDLAKKNKK